ncbi:hypothetical protein GCM10027347_58610 [Larkinella harenae]
MNECPECGGLLLEDNDEDAYMLTLDISMYCPGCGWCSDDEYENEELPDDWQNQL